MPVSPNGKRGVASIFAYLKKSEVSLSSPLSSTSHVPNFSSNISNQKEDASENDKMIKVESKIELPKVGKNLEESSPCCSSSRSSTTSLTASATVPDSLLESGTTYSKSDFKPGTIDAKNDPKCQKSLTASATVPGSLLEPGTTYSKSDFKPGTIDAKNDPNCQNRIGEKSSISLLKHREKNLNGSTSSLDVSVSMLFILSY
jgi:hypothetical protein